MRHKLFSFQVISIQLSLILPINEGAVTVSLQFSIKVYKQYFNFACAHFMIFENGSREPLHGHNYRVEIQGKMPNLNDDMVFDFLNIKPIVKKLCDELDHRLLIPKFNKHLRIDEQEKNFVFTTPDGSEFSIPKTDALLIDIENTSAERIAFYLNQKIRDNVWQDYNFKFQELSVEVEETPGQSAQYVHQEVL
jgi:6-pyruvoyltetrahydropterin/6-carboxytetrahydropterin synthase